MPSKQFRSLPAALRRRPVLGLIAILIVLVVAYVVSDNKSAGSGVPTSPSATTSLGLGVPSAGAPTSSGTTATTDPESGLRYVNESALPAQARKTLALIASDGPFPYTQDGGTFQNRERILPAHPAGYYTEYTVPTPGEDDRGSRRIITGAGGQLYYTGDHYSSFERIRLGL